jgi:DNA-binding MarR family transcriptional regulator
MPKTTPANNIPSSPHELFISSKIIRLAFGLSGRRNEILSSCDLLPGCDEMLLVLVANDGVTMGTLAELTGASASSTAKTAAKLEAKELIRRESSRMDSRQTHAFLTESGREMAGKILENYTTLESGLNKSLKTRETERLLISLQKIANFLNGEKPVKLKKPKKPGKKKSIPDETGKSKKKK